LIEKPHWPGGKPILNQKLLEDFKVVKEATEFRTSSSRSSLKREVKPKKKKMFH
jgi:hypothetical protein